MGYLSQNEWIHSPLNIIHSLNSQRVCKFQLRKAALLLSMYTNLTNKEQEHTHTHSSVAAAVFLKDGYSSGATCDLYRKPKTYLLYS